MFFPPQPTWAYGQILNIMAREEYPARELQSSLVGRGARCAWVVTLSGEKRTSVRTLRQELMLKKSCPIGRRNFTDVFMVRSKFLPSWPTIQMSVNLATLWMQFLNYSFTILAHNVEHLTQFWIILLDSARKKNCVYPQAAKMCPEVVKSRDLTCDKFQLKKIQMWIFFLSLFLLVDIFCVGIFSWCN